MLSKLKINIKINLVLTLLMILLILIVSIVYSYYRNKTFWDTTDTVFSEELEHINNTFHEIYQDDRAEVEASVAFANYYMQSLGEIKKRTNTFGMDAVNQLTQKRSQVQVNQWNIGNEVIHYNNKLAERIGNFTNTQVAFLQKISRGYIRIASNIQEDKANSAIGTYVPNSSVVVETVERGQSYKGNAYVFNTRYHTAYIPLRINGSIQGMLFVGRPVYDKAMLQRIFGQRNYNDIAQFMMINEEGSVLISEEHQGENLSQSGAFKRMKAIGSKVRSFRYEKTNYKGQETNFVRYYKYNQEVDAFFVVDVSVNALKSASSHLKYAGIIPAVILIILFSAGIGFFSRKNQKRLETIKEHLRKLARGIIPHKIHTKSNDEIGGIIQNLNKLIDGYSATVKFADEIKKGNLQVDYKARDEEDKLGSSLLEMRDSLHEARKGEEKRQQANQNQQWLNEGIAKFSDILRKENKDAQKLAYNVISELVKYLNANQGGFFIVNTNDNQASTIDLYASYAFEKERMYQKSIDWGVGLIGRSVQEQKTLHIKEIPEDYSDISSGLGSAKPSAVMVFPLVANQQVLGAIELASFSSFSEIQLNFVNNIAESIAITLITVQSNLKTEELLENSKQQAEELSSQEEEMRQNLEELQATQESAARREKEMESIIEALNATNLVMHFDINGVIEDINDNFLRTIDASREEVIGITIDFLIPAHKKEEHIKTWEKIKRGEMVSKQSQYEFRNKSLKLNETLTPIADDEGNYYKVLSISAQQD